MNNFIKTMLLVRHGRTATETAASTQMASASVMELACGRGQDVYKLEHLAPKNVLFVDLADQCLRMTERRWRRNESPYQASFVQADFTVPNFLDGASIMYYKHALVKRQSEHEAGNAANRQSSRGVIASAHVQIRGASPLFDVVSCQFGVQYAARDLVTLDIFLSNVSRYMSPDGVFVGILPDAHKIGSLLQRSGLWSGPHCALCLADSNDLERLCGGSDAAARPSSNSLVGVHQQQHDQEPPSILLADSKPETANNNACPIISGIPPGSSSSAPTGICYRFTMDDTLRCFEYTINFDDMVRLAAVHGLTLLHTDNAAHYARRDMADPVHRTILRRMGLVRHLLSVAEWDTVGMYRVFAFSKKQKDSNVA
jgi:SAM-dependent methyltransferase